MKTIHIGFSAPRKWMPGAAAISWWTGNPYSHTYLRFEYCDSRDAIFHAAHGSVHFMSVGNFQRDNRSIKEYIIEVSPQLHDQLFDQCMDLAGEKYSVMELVNILISDIAFQTFKKEIKTYNNRGYICSELMGQLCQDQLKLSFNKPLFLLKPSDIDRALSNNFPVVKY